MSGLHKDGDLTYEILIGCEIHCELKTPTKAFCACENRYGGMPNTRVCPVCLGLPGAMPVPSKEFVELALRPATPSPAALTGLSRLTANTTFTPTS